MRALVLCALPFGCAAADAAGEGNVATLADAGARLLRGATWYKLVPGARIEDGDIVEAAKGAQFQLELVAGKLNVVGPAALHVVRASGAAQSAVALPRGWMKAEAKPPGLRIRTAHAEVACEEGIVVVRSSEQPQLFVERGSARLVELASGAAKAKASDAKRGEHWARRADGAWAMSAGIPKAFVDAMPRHYADALPALAERYPKPAQLTPEGDITFAEAEPWLVGRERSAFEKRFAVRLRDPAFRRAVEPTIARYPSWDRMLHPEKFAPKPASAP
jgi:hypothetical protein